MKRRFLSVLFLTAALGFCWMGGLVYASTWSNCNSYCGSNLDVALANACLATHSKECIQQGHCMFTKEPAPVASTFELARTTSGIRLACLRTVPGDAASPATQGQHDF